MFFATSVIRGTRFDDEREKGAGSRYQLLISHSISFFFFSTITTESKYGNPNLLFLSSRDSRCASTASVSI
ncbi:hypothetical protein AAC387_Pa09g2254 [Persea americana]